MVLLRFNDDKEEWIQIQKEERLETDIYLDANEKKVLDHYKKLKKRNNDVVLIISGLEGSGKSTKMGTILEYMSNGKFDPTKDLIGSDYLDGLEKIEKAKESGCIGFDEGNAFFLSTETAKREHRDLHKIFSIFRQKHLFVAICLPGFFRMGTYFAMDRSLGLIITYFSNEDRGYFKFYGKKKKDNLYRKGKKAGYDDSVVDPSFRGRFTKCFKLETAEYKEFKRLTLAEEIRKAKSNIKKPLSPIQIKREKELEIIKNNPDLTTVQLGKILGKAHNTISVIRGKIKESSDCEIKNLQNDTLTT